MWILPEPIAFEWDKGNTDKNLHKHNVTIQEAEEMFVIEPFVARKDDHHSVAKEERFQALGKTRSGRKLFTAFTIRQSKIRVISIRDMTTREEQAYEKHQKNS